MPSTVRIIIIALLLCALVLLGAFKLGFSNPSDARALNRAHAQIEAQKAIIEDATYILESRCN